MDVVTLALQAQGSTPSADTPSTSSSAHRGRKHSKNLSVTQKSSSGDKHTSSAIIKQITRALEISLHDGTMQLAKNVNAEGPNT